MDQHEALGTLGPQETAQCLFAFALGLFTGLWARKIGPVSMWAPHLLCSQILAKRCGPRCLCWRVRLSARLLGGGSLEVSRCTEGPVHPACGEQRVCPRNTSRSLSLRMPCRPLSHVWLRRIISSARRPLHLSLPLCPGLYTQEPGRPPAEGGDVETLIWNKPKSLLCAALK